MYPGFIRVVTFCSVLLCPPPSVLARDWIFIDRKQPPQQQQQNNIINFVRYEMMTFCSITIGDWIARTQVDGFVSGFSCLVATFFHCIHCFHTVPSSTSHCVYVLFALTLTETAADGRKTKYTFFVKSVRAHQIRADSFSVLVISFNRQVQPHMHVSHWRWFEIIKKEEGANIQHDSTLA